MIRLIVMQVITYLRGENIAFLYGLYSNCNRIGNNGLIDALPGWMCTGFLFLQIAEIGVLLK